MNSSVNYIPPTDAPSRQKNPRVSDAKVKKQLRRKLFAKLLRTAWKLSGNPLKAYRLLHKLRGKHREVFGEELLNKVASVDGRYFWRMSGPGFPSDACNSLYESELSRFFPQQPKRGLRTLILAITKKCPLQCEHCFEWKNLNKEEKLSVDDLHAIVKKYQEYGTSQMMFSGGEPMLRFNDLIAVLEGASPGTDFWIITSGLGLSKERAEKLKSAGLTGVLVSLDHHQASGHNGFRGYDQAFTSATEAVAHANEAGLVTAFSLCATKEYISEENLAAYMDLARHMGVTYVQILEPRAVGRYGDAKVLLEPIHTEVLETIYKRYNTEAGFEDYPIISYHGYFQRRVGCFGAGDRFFYIDTDGDAHICPFCNSKKGSALDLTPEEAIGTLQESPCELFNKAVF